jgi:hypothetical protein
MATASALLDRHQAGTLRKHRSADRRPIVAKRAGNDVMKISHMTFVFGCNIIAEQTDIELSVVV